MACWPRGPHRRIEPLYIQHQPSHGEKAGLWKDWWLSNQTRFVPQVSYVGQINLFSLFKEMLVLPHQGSGCLAPLSLSSSARPVLWVIAPLLCVHAVERGWIKTCRTFTLIKSVTTGLKWTPGTAWPLHTQITTYYQSQALSSTLPWSPALIKISL